MHEIAIRRVTEYLDEDLFEPGSDWPEDIFEERSYARWAAGEIIHSLMDHPMLPPELVIESFMVQMAIFSYTNEDPSKQRIFSIARDTAEDILSLFL